MIAWNQTIRATGFAFPHQFDELLSYGEYIISLFATTNLSFHSHIIMFDKVVRRRVRSIRNVKLWNYEWFSDLKIAHIDSIRVSVGSGVDEKCSKGRGSM